MTSRSAEEQNKLSRERFGKRADDYRESELHAGGPDLELLLEWVDAQPLESALDVATGGGHVALALARAGAVVHACDLTPEMLEAACELLEESGLTAAFQIAEAEALPYADASFDIVTCRIAAHHFPSAEAFFAEAMRVLKPGGRLGFQDQTLPPVGPSAVLTDTFERTRDGSHNQSYNERGWVTLIERAGMTVVRTELVDKKHDFAEWVLRQDCGPAAIAELEQLMREAPEGMQEWLQPVWDGERLKEFRNRHLVLLATKPG